MGKVRVATFSISVDGFGAGTAQTLDAPLGVGGEELHNWFVATRTFRTMYGDGQGSTGIDEQVAADGMANLGAWILGRNMFGPIRGDWGDDEWKGWWGDNPPYHVPVFVLTHHPRDPLEMDGGTTFHFVTDGIEAALERAREAAGAKDIRIGGGAETIRQFLQAGLIDELQISVAPILLGNGEPLFQGLDLKALGYMVTKQVAGEGATHVFIARAG